MSESPPPRLVEDPSQTELGALLRGLRTEDLHPYDVDAAAARFETTLADDPGHVSGEGAGPPAGATSEGVAGLAIGGVFVVVAAIAATLAFNTMPENRVTEDPFTTKSVEVPDEPVPVPVPVPVPDTASQGVATTEDGPAGAGAEIETIEPAEAVGSGTGTGTGTGTGDGTGTGTGALGRAKDSGRPEGEGSRAKRREPSAPSEIELVQQMRASLASDPGRALELARRGERAYPKGMFVRERRAHIVFALSALGRKAEAQAAGDAFLRSYPQGPLADRVRGIVEP